MYQRRSYTRYFVRTDQPRKGLSSLLLLGSLLLALPLLYGFFWFAKNNIETNTRLAVEKELLSSGLDWLEVDVDGQDVTLRGNGETSQTQQALQIAEASIGGTWLGGLVAPISVKVEIEETKTPSLPLEPAAEIEPQWGNTVSALNNGVLELSGSVGGKGEERALIQTVKNYLPSTNVNQISHNLNVIPRTFEGSLELAMLATSMLSHCKTGKASTTEGVLDLSCTADASGAEAIALIQAEPPAKGNFGSVDVKVNKTCESSFIKLLETASIHFEEGSNVLPKESNQQLDGIAKLMLDCPKLLRIDGHTDDIGDKNFNMNLSFQRAMAGVEALVARGVDRKYIVPYAFGFNQPRANKKSETARATNRRIEIHLFSEG